MQGLLFIFFLVCLNIGYSKSSAKEKTQLSDIENSDSNKSPTSSIPSDVESRFFDLGGVIKQLFPGFNQGGAGGNPGLNLPSNSQFYPGGGVPAQNWNPLNPINQGNRWYPNQQNIARPLFQNQGSLPDSNFNQQGSINNINQPEQYLNQAGLGQYPANLNGNLINGGGKQKRQPGNLQNSGFQGQPSQLGRRQGHGRPNYDPNAFEYPGRKPAHPNQGESNFNNNFPSYNEGPENCFDYFDYDNIPQNQFPQSNTGQTSTNQNNNGPNQYPGQDYYPNGIGNQNGMRPNQRPQNQNSNNNDQKYEQRQPNQNNMNQFPNEQGSSANQGTPSDQFQQGANNRRQNNVSPPRGNVNNNLPANVNQQGTNLNNNNRPNQQNNQNQGVQPNPGQASSGNSNGAVRYPDDYDDDFGQTTSIPIATITTIAPTTKSPTVGNAIIGKPVLIPTSTVLPGQVVFVNGDVTTASQKECVQNCPTSSEYNPVCGTDNVSYFNPGRMLCARNCGINVFESRKGNCDRNK